MSSAVLLKIHKLLSSDRKIVRKKEKENMTPKEYVTAVQVTVAAIENNLIDTTTGDWKKQPDLPDDATVIAEAEQAFVSNGLVLSTQVTAIINALVGILPLLGGLIK
jgi:hypothetical protein